MPTDPVHKPEAKLELLKMSLLRCLTLPKYRSSTSTYRCTISSVISSLSPDPIPQTKKREAYRRYTTFVSGWEVRFQLISAAYPHAPLYSKKLHILVLLASTSCVTSLTIFAFALGGMVVNHFASRTLPVTARGKQCSQCPNTGATCLVETPRECSWSWWSTWRTLRTSHFKIAAIWQGLRKQFQFLKYTDRWIVYVYPMRWTTMR
jgi:hypothetical protein